MPTLYEALPLVAVWDYGRGRSLAVATDASWFVGRRRFGYV
ncbi:hypothetical protein [Archangium sp.]|nr:hypothetical protein [Archangium sp.]